VVLRAVLDANVYVSAYVRPEGPPGQIIERFLNGGAFGLVMSSEIAAEALHALACPKVRKAARPRTESELWFEDILVLTQMIPGEYRVAPISSDADDDKYVAAAIEGGAAFVVSGDPDLLEIAEHEACDSSRPELSWTCWVRPHHLRDCAD
jgi:putative PIN family toxin of toxin-antitoxin system